MKRMSKMFYITFCILFILSCIAQGQVKIQEKISIQSLSKSKRGITDETYLPLVFVVTALCPSFNFTISAPEGSYYGDGGTGNQSVELNVPAQNGTYYLTIYSLVPAGGTTQASYMVAWGDQGIASDIHYISNMGNDEDAIIPTTFTFTFGGIPTLYNFSLFFDHKEICGLEDPWLKTTYNMNTTEVGNKNIAITLINDSTDAVLYDNSLNQYLGTSTTTTLALANNISVRMNSIYTGESDTKLIVTGVAEGLTRSDTLTVLSAKEFTDYKIETWPDEPTETNNGKTEWFYVYTSRGGDCGLPWEYLPEETKYNLVVLKGSQYGYIGYQPDGDEITQKGTELYNLDHDYGSLYFVYQSYGDIPISRDTIVIRVSTTDPDIVPVDLELFIEPNSMSAHADPNPIFIGETSQIIKKHFTNSGAFEDFPSDAVFDIEIFEGNDYGTLYSSATSETSDYFYDTPGDFSFVAADSIDADSVSVMIWMGTWVESGAGVISGNITSTGEEQSTQMYDEGADKVISKKEIVKMLKEKRRGLQKTEHKNWLNNISKGYVGHLSKGKGSGSSNIMSGYEYIDAEFEIIVKKKKTTFYVKADFEKENLSAGDTVNVIVKKVDEGGNQFDFPATTNFEVGLKEGCGAGYILDVGGQPREYIQSIQKPIRFVVNDTLTEADTLVSLRVGVPSSVDTLYKPYDEFLSQQQLNKVPPSSTRQNKQSAREVTAGEYCSIPNFLYSGYGIAVGTIGGNCEECDQTNLLSEPVMPIINIVNFSDYNICLSEYDNSYPRPAGLFHVYWDDPYYDSELYNGWRKNLHFLCDFDMNACYNFREDFWQFYINNGNGFQIRTFINVCLSNIREQHPSATFIYSPDQLNEIPTNDRKKALQDFEWQRTHYGLDNNQLSYILIPGLWAHESEHRKRFKVDLYEAQKTLINSDAEFLKFIIVCEPLFGNPKEKAINIAEARYREEMNYLQNIVHDLNDLRFEQKDPETNDPVEEFRVQFAEDVQAKYWEYINKLNNL